MTVDRSKEEIWRELRERNALGRQIESEAQSLKSGGGGDNSGGMSDDWKTSVNSQLAQLHQDVRNLLYGLIGIAAFVLVAGAAAYSKLDGQIDTLGSTISEIRVGQAKVDAKLDLLLERSMPSNPPKR